MKSATVFNNNPQERDAWLHRLRGNRVLGWVEEFEDVSRYSEILDTCPINSTLEIESGIVKINPMNGSASRYIGHRFVPHVKAGFSFQEVATVLKAKIVEFEHEYGKVEMTSEDIYNLKQLVYQFNQAVSAVDFSDRKRLIHLEHSAEVLYYLLTPRVVFSAGRNGWCSLVFLVSGDKGKDYCTIFSEEQIKLLERVSASIQPLANS